MCLAAGPPWRRRQGLPCDPALGGAQQAVYPGFRGLLSDPYESDAREAGRSNTRRERIAYVLDAFADIDAGYAPLSFDNMV